MASKGLAPLIIYITYKVIFLIQVRTEQYITLHN